MSYTHLEWSDIENKIAFRANALEGSRNVLDDLTMLCNLARRVGRREGAIHAIQDIQDAIEQQKNLFDLTED